MESILSDPPQQLVRYVINRHVPFKVAARYAGIDLPVHEGSCFCPFHANADTPAAKLYIGEKGDSIHCFAEQRSYRPYDLFKQGLINKDVTTVFLRIWSQLSDQQRDEAMQETNAVPNYTPIGWDELLVSMRLYKEGAISYINICETLLQLRPNRN